MIGQDIVNYYLNNPPFEITNAAKYIEFLQFQSNMTLMELSEIDPVLSETTVAPIIPVADEEYVKFDLRLLNEHFYKLILFEATESIYDAIVNASMYSRVGRSDFGMVTSTAINAAMRSGSLVNLIAVNDYTSIIEEWFKTKKQFMVFDSSFIKILPNTEYYALFKRYKDISELNSSDIRLFKRLLGINIMLDIYQTDIFASEGGIKSVSLSGLSVSFNVPKATTKVNA